MTSQETHPYNQQTARDRTQPRPQKPPLVCSLQTAPPPRLSSQSNQRPDPQGWVASTEETTEVESQHVPWVSGGFCLVSCVMSLMLCAVVGGPFSLLYSIPL